MYLYALRSKSQQRYCAPFLANDDSEAISIVSRMVISQSDPALLMSLDDMTLNVLAVYDPALITSPIVEMELSLVIMTDLHKDLPLPPLVKEKVDALYDKEDKV